MGCSGSKKKIINAEFNDKHKKIKDSKNENIQVQKKNSLLTAKRKGSFTFSTTYNTHNNSSHHLSQTRKTFWYKMEEDELLGNDNLPDLPDISDYLECLKMLTNPVGQRYLGNYAKKILTTETLLGWLEIQEYKAIPESDFRRSRAQVIFNKYLKVGAMQEIGDITTEERNEILNTIQICKHQAKYLPSNLFLKIQKKCFLEIYQHTYLRFKKEEVAKNVQYMNEIAETYNRVTVDDFDYLEKLGEGAFGRVIHVRKKSTNKHYAMKIQSKYGLLRNCRHDINRLLHERKVYAACKHPFIVGLDYAFQNECHAILVLTLAPSGTLQDAIYESTQGRLPEVRVILYVAELILALSYLHDMGLMYRDLKPRNVLLNHDGHISLADMGGCGDFKGKIFATKKQRRGSRYDESGILRTSSNNDLKGRGYSVDDENTFNSATTDDDEAPRRRMSIMGTKGYMAPEMVLMMTQRSHERMGYTEDKVYDSYDDMMQTLNYIEIEKYGKLRIKWDQPPELNDQSCFRNWNQISPTTFKMEMGIANESKAISSNPKVQQLTGQVSISMTEDPNLHQGYFSEYYTDKALN